MAICMKYQILFSGENKKNIINLSSAELAQCGNGKKSTIISIDILTEAPTIDHNSSKT